MHLSMLSARVGEGQPTHGILTDLFVEAWNFDLLAMPSTMVKRPRIHTRKKQWNPPYLITSAISLYSNKRFSFPIPIILVFSLPFFYCKLTHALDIDHRVAAPQREDILSTGLTKNQMENIWHKYSVLWFIVMASTTQRDQLYKFIS